jgi:hypothetical protein
VPTVADPTDVDLAVVISFRSHSRQVTLKSPTISIPLMRTADHAAAGFIATSLLPFTRHESVEFVAGSVLIDLNYYPGAIKKYGIRNPIDGCVFALTGNLPSLAADDPQRPIEIDRPLHRIETAIGLGLLALLIRRARPAALGLLLHLALDVLDIMTDRRTA